MNRFPRGDFSLLKRSGSDEEELYEKQALIDDQELFNNESDSITISNNGIRCRQANKIKPDFHEDHELRSLNSYDKTRDPIYDSNFEYTLYDIQPDDTLQSICLRYAISVNQTKRINGLMSDQDFYGLKKIKLPLGKLGLLEDILRSKNLATSSDYQNHLNRKNVNSPGSALSVTKSNQPPLKPFLGSAFSSDRLDDCDRLGETNKDESTITFNNNNMDSAHNHSSASLRELTTDVDICFNKDPAISQFNYVDIKKLKEQNFIKSNLDQKEARVQDLVTDSETADKVFEDLDYHVERAKAAAETYDKRAAELVNRLDNIRIEPSIMTNSRQPPVSKIPELFLCNESFGLNYKKLLVLIFFICLVVPLVSYYNQTNVVTTPLK